MSLTLHAATVPNWLQILGAAKGWLDKAADSGIAERELVEGRLIEDMLPLAYQVNSMAVHSQGAIEAVREGVFSPPIGAPLPASFGEMRDVLNAAIAFLESVGVDEMQALVGRPMRFEIGERRFDFTAEEFLLTFSQTNFFFHAVSAYAILRAKGVDVGKRDYIGQLRLVQPA